MVTKFATFLTVTAIALIGVTAEANVPDSLDGQNRLSDSVPQYLINQIHSHDQCDASWLSGPVFPSVNSPHEKSVRDLFVGNFSALDGVQAADSCKVPVPGPDPFENVAMR